MRLISTAMKLNQNIIDKLKENNITHVEELWVLKRSELKNIGFSNEQINDIIISLQLIGLDLNKKKY